MKILAHRGLWTTKPEQNTIPAFQAAIDQGFGIETDLRDAGMQVVISHDMARGNEPPLQSLLEIPAANKVPLALNVKADGLAVQVAQTLESFSHPDAFVFDMSIPDTRHWLRAGVPVFLRVSDVEPEPSPVGRPSGIWLDSFGSEWWKPSTVQGILNQGLRVAVVSPELHSRPHQPVWTMLRDAGLQATDSVILCTDFPHEARAFFE